MAVEAPGWCIPYWWSQQNREEHAFSQCQEGQYKTLCQKCLDMFVKVAQKIMPTSFIVTEQIGTKFDIIE